MSRIAPRLAVALVFAALAGAPAAAQEAPAPAAESETGSTAAPPAERAEPVPLAVLPFRIHSARSLGYLTESLADLLATRLDATGRIRVVDSSRVRDALGESRAVELSDADLRRMAERVGARAVVTGSLTELAGRFSLDVRVTPADGAGRSRSIVFTAASEEDLLGRLSELAGRVSDSIEGVAPSRVVAVNLLGAGELEAELAERIRARPGQLYDPDSAEEDRSRLEDHPSVASASLDAVRDGEAVTLRFQVVRSEFLFGAESVGEAPTLLVSDVQVRGNRRIEADAIRARVRTRVGEPLRANQVAADVREVFGLGFFRTVNVLAEERPEGVILTFVVEENPVVRQISIAGNEEIDSDQIRDALTLTTGSTLDHPQLRENVDRIEALYRAEGYYLAEVTFEIDPLSEGSVAVNFDVDEKEKLRLREVVFEGNEAFSDGQLMEDFDTRLWRPWSYLTSWFDRSGTYSEPVFLRDLRQVEKRYTDSGYLQVEMEEPEVNPTEKGLTVTVKLNEGPQFRVGKIDVSGDANVDLSELRKQLQLSEGEVFNRSFLTEDVEGLERHYTDLGFFSARVEPDTQLSEGDRLVDVDFQVRKGPLYFIRHIDIAGNTRTVDEVIRRELRMVEGQLYSARALQISDRRVRNLRYFEDVSFEPKPSRDPSQIDLEVRVVERPTGSFSLGAGFSSQDKLVFNASLSQSNLFGRGYGANLSADLGGSTSRFFLSLSDPYFLGSQFSLSGTAFITRLRFDSFDQDQLGFDINLGHSLREDNTARGFLRYSLVSRKVDQDLTSGGSATVLREIRQGSTSTSLIGLSFVSDTRNDRFSPTRGLEYGASAEFAGLGGFTNFLRFEGRGSWYIGAPKWLIPRSTFVLSGAVGYVVPFNTIADFDDGLLDAPECVTPGRCTNVGNLDQIDTDLELPLSERYFLGGIGSFQLRGYRARSVGPRRASLTFTRTGRNLAGDLVPLGGTVFFPLGRTPTVTTVGGETFITGACQSVLGCNSLSDEKDEDFAVLDFSDVVGGTSFVSASFEYRFPVSQEIGLQAVAFVDMGNAFAEGENLFDVTRWRYGSGGGLLWFSPFGPLQIVLGFPLNPLSIEESPVFEFSVGGFGG